MTRLTRILLAGTAIGATGLFLPAAAAAQDAKPQPAAEQPAEVSATTDNGGIADIVVTARRVNESAQKVPVAITVLGPVQLRDSTIKNIRDLLGSAPALDITSGAGGPSAANIAIRGQTQADVQLTTDPSVAVYLNDISLPRQVGLRASFLDLAQVEVLKGPQGTLFGKNTTGGALILKSKLPDLKEFGGYVNLQGAEHGQMQITGAIGGPLIEDQLGIRLAAQQTYRGGFGRNGNGQRIGNQYDRDFRGSILWEPNSRVKLLVTADYSNGKNNGSIIKLVELNPLAFSAAGAPLNSLSNLLKEVGLELGLKPKSTLLTVADYTTAYNVFSQRGFQTSGFYNTNNTVNGNSYLDLYGFSGDLSIDLGPATVRSITGYRNTSRYDFQDYGATGFNIVQPINFTYAGSFTQELQLVSPTGGRFGWIVGGYYAHEKGNEGSTTTQLFAINPTGNPNFTDSTVTNKTYAAFAQANYKITDTVRLTAGARYTDTNEVLISRSHTPLACSVPVVARPDPAVCSGVFKTGSRKPSWLISLDWQAAPDVLLYTSAAHSFRGGGINARGGATVDSYGAFGPETATNYEVGFKGDLLDRHLRINAAGYYTDYKGIQRSTTLIGATGALVTIVNNAAAGEVYGAEVEVTARPTSNLTLGGSFNWTHTGYKVFNDLTLGDRSKEPFAVPQYQYTLNGKYTLPIGDNQLSLYGAYRWQSTVNLQGSALVASSVTQKAYGLLEARLAYRLANPSVEIALYGKNLTDKQYYTNFLAFDRSLGYNIGFAGEPRQIGVEVKFAFGGG
jgi:iron complex outermembrane receptor protein